MQNERINKFSGQGFELPEVKPMDQTGFTLVELMVALIIGLIATAGIYKTYVMYNAAADYQEKTLELQQNLRVSMQTLLTDLRLAGLDPQKIGTTVGFEQADQSSFTITWDKNIYPTAADPSPGSDTLDNDGDGATDEPDEAFYKKYGDGDVSDAGEKIRYFIKAPDANCSGYGLGREDVNAGTGEECININMDPPAVSPATTPIPLDFVYLDKDGGVIASPVAATQLAEICYVQVSMVLRSVNEDYSYTNKESFNNLRGTTVIPAQNDHYYRKQLLATVDIRNMDLE